MALEVEYPSQAGMTEREKEIDRRILAKVLNGIELLKREHGDEWYMKIDLNTLALSSPHKCVLGQLYDGNPSMSGYERGASQLGISGTDGEYGFSALGIMELSDELGPDGFWTQLTDAWRQEIGHLREVAAV